MTAGLTLGNADSLLTDRAADYLAAGPADPQSLISHVCQIPGAPASVAEHIAAALCAGHRRLVRERDGRWSLRDLAHPANDLSALPSKRRAARIDAALELHRE